MKESKNIANLSKEDLSAYRKICFLKYGAQKYEYSTQIETMNHFFHNKGICYPLRRELAFPKSLNMKLSKTNLIRQLLVADRSITILVEGGEDSDYDSDEGYTSTMLSSESTVSSTQSITLAQKLKQKINIDEGESLTSFSLKSGRIRITTHNYQLVIKVLKALKEDDCPNEVFEFLNKLISNIEGTEFSAQSSTHKEKLMQLFYYKLFRYASYAFKKVADPDPDHAGSQRMDTPSVKSMPDSGVILTVKKEFETYIESTIDENVREALEDPRKNLSNIGYIAGLSCCLKYLDDDTADAVVSALRKQDFITNENFNDVIPICISIIENFSDKFANKEKQKMRKICIRDAKKGKSKSKKLYLALQFLFSKDDAAQDIDEETLEKFNARSFLTNKSLAKLFIRFFVGTYYNKQSLTQNKPNTVDLEILIQSLKRKQKNTNSSYHRKQAQIVNYILTEILSYDILKHGFTSFENMKAYSLIFDSFKGKGAQEDDNESDRVSNLQAARQIDFFLKIYQNSLSFLSRTPSSADSMVSSLSLILTTGNISNLL
jgi:hypothetical protein